MFSSSGASNSLQVQVLLVLGNSLGWAQWKNHGPPVVGGALLKMSRWRWPYGCSWASSLVLKNMEFRPEGTLGLVVECEICLGLVGEHFQYGQ